MRERKKETRKEMSVREEDGGVGRMELFEFRLGEIRKINRRKSAWITKELGGINVGRSTSEKQRKMEKDKEGIKVRRAGVSIIIH